MVAIVGTGAEGEVVGAAETGPGVTGQSLRGRRDKRAGRTRGMEKVHRGCGLHFDREINLAHSIMLWNAFGKIGYMSVHNVCKLRKKRASYFTSKIMTLTCLTARSYFVIYIFEWVKTVKKPIIHN